MKLRARELEELAAGERRYRRIVENVPHAIALLDLEGIVVDVNPQLESLLGYPRDEILGRPCQPFTHPEDHERELPMLEAVLHGESDGYTIEKRYERADGSFVWANLALASIRDDHGAPTQLLAVIEDISERHRLARELAASETRYRLVVETTTSGVWMADTSERAVFVNEQLARMLGRTPEEMLGRHRLDFIWPDDHELAIERYRDRAAGESGEIELRLLRADGSPLWAHIAANPIQAADGVVTGTLALITDISERKEAEQELRAAEARYRGLVENLPLATYLCDLETSQASYISPQHRELTGRDQEWLLGPDSLERYRSIVHPDDRPDAIAKWDSWIASGGEGEYRFEHRIVRPNGEVRWVDSSAIRVGTRGGRQLVQGLLVDVTERKAAAEELKRAEERYRGLIENLPLATYLSDFETNEANYISPQHGELTGRDPSWFYGPDGLENYRSLVHPEDVDRIRRVRDSWAAAGGVGEYRTEHRIIRPDGQIRWIDSSVIKVGTDAEGRQLVQGFLVDITDRKHAEAQLLEAELSYRTLVEQLPLVTFTLTADGRVDWISPQVEEMFGMAPAELVAGGIDMFGLRVHPDDAHVKSTLLTWLRDGMPQPSVSAARYRVRHSDGHWVWVTSTAQVIRAEDGTPLEVQGFILDISNLVSAEQEIGARLDEAQQARDVAERSLEQVDALRDANEALTRTLDLEHVLRALLDSLAHFIPRGRAGVFLLDGRGRLVLQALHGGGTNGGRARQVVRPSEAARAVLEGGRTIVVPGDGRDGDVRSLVDGSAVRSWMGVPLRARGDVVGLCAIESVEPNAFTEDDVEWAEALISQAAVAIQNARLHDELRRHAASLERRVADRTRDLRRAKDEAVRANRAKSDFLAGISHELRTPMNAILGFAQLLELEKPTGADAESVQQILRAGRHLLQLITELLDIARIEAGELALSIEPVSVAEIVHEALDLTRPFAAEAGITTTVSGDLSHYVRGDRQRVLQILLNLVSNAVKYNRPGGSVDIACADADDGRVTLAVTDTGRGIAADDLERLFVPFDRLGLEAGTIEGAGLGLTLVGRLVEVMGGTLSVDSTEGVGSTFTLSLPAAEDPLAPVDTPTLPAGPERSRSATVLYVEDNLANLKLVERALARQPGIKVLAATKGRLGIELARERRPDVVLLDLHLPDITGEEVLQELISDGKTADIPVIVVSAAASKGRVHRLRQLGARDYLTKPIDLAQLLDAVNAALTEPRRVR